MTPMENWQFLIQKQGDRNWQLLESPNIKIIAGKYRILARSHFLNTDVEVRVIHSSNQEHPPKGRIFKRSRRTNPDGLMAVIPFTDLKPGIWELYCSADLMTNMLGQSWQHSLILTVLPLELNEPLLLHSIHELDKDEEQIPPRQDEFAVTSSRKIDINTVSIETPENTSENTPENTPENTIINQPVSQVLFKGESAEQILQSLIDFALPNYQTWDEEPANEDTLPPLPTLPPSSPLDLSLERDTYICSWGKTLVINGYVQPPEIENTTHEILLTTHTHHCFQLQLITELRSPLESNILAEFKQPLTNQILPFTFSTIIEIPKDCESKLILANVNLYGTLTKGGEVILLASHPFIITADVTELLTVTSAKSREKPSSADLLTDHKSLLDEDLATETELTLSGVEVLLDRVNLQLFNSIKSPELGQFNILNPVPNKPLPPRIKPLIFVDTGSPALPKLPRIHKNAITNNSANPDLNVSESHLSLTDLNSDQHKSLNDNKLTQLPPINLEKLVITQVKNYLPYLKPLKSVPKSEQIIENNLSQPENTVPLVTVLNVEELNTPETTLKTTSETPDLIKKWIAAQGYLVDEVTELGYQEDDNQFDIQQANNASDKSNLTVNDEHHAVTSNFTDELLLNLNLNLDPEREIEEFIELPEHMILDRIEPTFEPEQSPSISQLLDQEIVIDDSYISVTVENSNQPSQAQEQLLDISPPPVTSLPTPQMFLPNGELLAGSSIKVRLEMSQASSTVAVKLWVEDYQTRALLDKPHLLEDLRLTPWGYWEAIAQLTVPLDCLKVLIGAIALDTNTQQESHKVTIVKTVVPLNLPTIELDEVLGM